MKIALLILFYSVVSLGRDVGIAPSWQLELYHNNTKDGQFKMNCKASMLSEQWAITAAHCTSYTGSALPLDSQDVYLKDRKGSTYKVDYNGIYNYQHFNGSNFANDFSLLKITLTKGVSHVTHFPKIPNFHKRSSKKKVYTTIWAPVDKKGIHHYYTDVNLKISTSSLIFNVQSKNYPLCSKNPDKLSRFNNGSNSGSALYTTDKKGQDLLIGVHSRSALCTTSDPYFFTNLTSFSVWIKLLMEYSS